MRSLIVSLTATAAIGLASNVLAIDMPPLAKKNNCVACHAIDHKIVGPAWMDVSRLYKDATVYVYRGKEYPLEEGLIQKVSHGGAGNWGAMPMPGNAPAVSPQDIKALVEFELSLARK